jgi:hypothetical protein
VLRFTGNFNGIDYDCDGKAAALPRLLGLWDWSERGVGEGLSDRGFDWVCEFRRCCLSLTGLYWLILLGFRTFVSSVAGSRFVPTLGRRNNNLMTVFLLL